MNTTSWRHHAALLAVMAGVTVLAACGASNPSTGSTATGAPSSTTIEQAPTSTVTPTTAMATTTTNPNAAVRALAATINLTRTDLPAGWSLAGPGSVVVLNKAACGLAATDAVALNGSIYTSAGSGEQAQSEVGVAATTTVAADFALFRGPSGDSCATKFIEQLNAGPVTISALSRLAAITTAAGTAIPMAAFQMVVKPTSATTTAPVVVDAFTIFSGRFEVFAVFSGATRSVAGSTETTAIRAIDARIGAASA